MGKYLSQPYLARNPEQTGWNQGQRIAFMHSEALRVIRAHYGVYLRSSLKAIFRTLFEFGEGSFNLLMNPNGATHTVGLMEGQGLAPQAIVLAKTYPWIAIEKAAFGLVMLGLYLLAARGVFRCGVQNASLWLLLGVSLYFIAISGAGGSGSARFRLPVMPVVCILASAGLRRPKRCGAVPE